MTSSQRYLLALISVILMIALVLLNAVAFPNAGFLKDTANLIQLIVPNLIASLIVFLAIYLFVERHIDTRRHDLNQFAQFTAPAKDFKDHIFRSTEALDKLRIELIEHKESIRKDINATLEHIKSSQLHGERGTQEEKLRELYTKLNEIEAKIANLDEKSAIKLLSERDKQIAELNAEIAKLNRIIQANRTIAKSIVETAAKI